MTQHCRELLTFCYKAFVCAAGLASFTTFCSSPRLDPSQVAKKFSQSVWQKREGLPDNQIQALLQTRDGFLWIGTHRGLARFDGLKFTVFDHLNTPEMPDDNILALAEDLDGNLWIGTGDGLLRLRNQTFARFTKKDGLASLPNSPDKVRKVFATRSGDVWVHTYGLTLIRNGTFRSFGKAEGLASTTIDVIAEDSAGVFWAAVSGYLCRFNEQARRFGIDPEFERAGIGGMESDANGGLWLICYKGNSNYGLCRFSHGKLASFSEDLLSNPRAAFFKSDRRGAFWMALDAGELDCVHDGRLTRYALPSSSANEFVLCTIEDREGNRWVGTESTGLHCWRPRAVSEFGSKDGLAHDNTWTVCETRDGNIWIGTEEGLSEFKEGAFHNVTQRDGLSGNHVRSVAEDSSGAVWIGTGSGLSIIRNGVVHAQPFPHKPERNKVRVVHPSKSGAVWVGTADGLYRFDGGQWTTYGLAQGLAHNDVRALREDSSGNLWIGTAGGGLQRFQEAKFSTFNTTNGLSSNFVWAFHEDSNGVLWIGTEMGLNRYDHDHFTTFTTRDGLPADGVNEILEDALGNLWISHDRGIYKVRKQELNDVALGRTKSVHATTYNESDGLPSIETNGQKSQPAGCKSRDGRLWFPTTRGVAVIDPKECAFDEVAPLVALVQVRADGEIIFEDGAEKKSSRVPLENENASSSLKGPRSLPPGTGRVIEFRYTAPVFIAPEEATFRYRLRGVDDRWIEAGTRREAYFTRLRPGAYDFQVLAANHRGVWGEQSSSFAFIVEPFFFQTWWFYALCGVAAASLIAGMVAWRIRGLRKLHRLAEQAAVVEERARIAKDLHDGLGADLTRLALLADLASEEPEAGSGVHLEKLSRSSREAARVLKEMIWIAHPANDTLEGLVSRIGQTAEDFLGDARIRCRLDLAAQLPEQPLTLDQRRNLLLVTREALNNIVKHANATEVCVRASRKGKTLFLAIEDNGRGFDYSSVRSAGLGLASMKRRVENLGGMLDVQTHPGDGTKILITLET